jgi:EAL domain-containing protein (putative c-di-GMP-specific phosphodiesterase class I)
MKHTQTTPTGEHQPMSVAVVHRDPTVAARLCQSLNAHRHRVEVYSTPEGLVQALARGAELALAFLGADDLVHVHACVGDRRTLLVQVGGQPDPAADAMLPARYTAAELRTSVLLLERVHRLSAEARRLEERVEVLRGAITHDLDLPVLAVAQVAERLSRDEATPGAVRAELEGLAAAALSARQRLDALRGADGGGPVRTPQAQCRATTLRGVVAAAMSMAGGHPASVRWVPEDVDPVVVADPSLLQQSLELLLAEARRQTLGVGLMEVRAALGAPATIELREVGTPCEGALEAAGTAVRATQGSLRVIKPRASGVGPTLQLELGPVLEHRPVALVSAHTPPPDEHLSVWLVDDETLVRRATERLLTHLRHEIRLFDRGSELVEALPDAVRPPDMILADAELPGMSGLDVLQRVRSLSPGAAGVLYTASTPGPAVVEAFNRGTVQRFVRKDGASNALEDILRTMVEDRRGRGRSGGATTSEADRVRVDLDDLIQGRRCVLFVQPIYDARSGAWVACEALLRSGHPSFKGPLEILDAARHADRQLELQRLLAELSRDLRDQLPGHVTLFVNADPIVLRSLRHVDEALGPLYPVAPGVVLELTERVRLSHEPGWEAIVAHLRSQGFRIALDDVGAGYNSLGAVAAVQPEVMKIDISLVSGLDGDTRKAELVRILAEYANRNGIATVAEGIERAEEASTCRDLGVRWLQGYHLGRPMPLDKLRAAAAA